MEPSSIIIIIIVGVVLLLVFYVIGVYNKLVNARNKVKDQFAQIDVQLKRRSDMIPNLVETVKGYALSEAYPELKSNENFLSLQKDLKETEDKLSYARQFYNDSVLMYNNTREKFPSNIVANIFGFKEINFFKASEKEKEVPNVKF